MSFSPPVEARAAGRPAQDHSPASAPVSVVVPCYRCADTIGPAVASVARQRRVPREVILVDDCSGDDTYACLQALAQAYPPGWIKVRQTPRNGGPSGARNLGWDQASEPFVAFLDADDSWHPQKIALQMEVVERDRDVALVAHPMNVQGREAPAPAVPQPLRTRVLPRHLLMLRHPVPTASILLRRDLPFRFDETRMRAEDFLLWAQILLSGYRCVRLEAVLASWHKPPFGAGGLSGDMSAMYRAAVDVRRTLCAQGLLPRWQLYLVHAFGLARYARRRVLASLRRPQQRAAMAATPGERH